MPYSSMQTPSVLMIATQWSAIVERNRGAQSWSAIVERVSRPAVRAIVRALNHYVMTAR
jgi:hypothetical protein